MAIYCARCGAEINEGSKFCKGCGAAVEAVPPPQAPQQYQAPQQQAPPQYQAPPQQAPPQYQAPQYAGQPQQGPQYAGQPPKKKIPTWLLIVIIAVAAIVFFYIIGTLSQGSDSGDDASGSDVIDIDIDIDDDAGDAGDPVDADDDGDAGPTQNTEFTDYPIVVGEGTDFPLQGMLSIPDVERKVPAVVLVHGDGVFDMDEEVFGNKPFRDIAEYLASNGIAVIRYDKRNFKHNSKMKEMYSGGVTAMESQMEDALRATELLKSDPRIDENKVFILGHSKGAALAPRIQAAGGGFAGIISMSGTVRSLFEYAFNEYFEYAMSMPEGAEKDEYMAAIEERVEQIRDQVMNMPDDEAKETSWGEEFTYYYYKDYENHLPPEYVKDISIPFLILQGSEDFSVSAMIDFPAWQDELAGRDNATFKQYEGLNHFLFPSPGYGSEDWEKEYSAPGHTDEQALRDIADFILSN